MVIICHDHVASPDRCKAKLETKLLEVIKKTAINASSIIWEIYNYEYYRHITIKGTEIIMGLSTSNWGHYRPETPKTIYISSQSIERGSGAPSASIHGSAISCRDVDFLADVILDEFSHYKTKRDHGNEVYDKALKEYRTMYFGLGYTETT